MTKRSTNFQRRAPAGGGLLGRAAVEMERLRTELAEAQRERDTLRVALASVEAYAQAAKVGSVKDDESPWFALGAIKAQVANALRGPGAIAAALNMSDTKEKA